MNRRNKWICVLLLGVLVCSMQVSAAPVQSACVPEGIELLVKQDMDVSKLKDDMSKEDIQALLKWLKEKIDKGELDVSDETSVRAAIEAGEEEFGVSFTEKEKDKIVSALSKLNAIGLSGEKLLEEAEKLFEKYGSGILDQTEETLRETVEDANEAINETAKEVTKEAAKGFLQRMKESVKGFFAKLFQK